MKRSSEPVITGIELAATHDGEAALVVVLRYPDGGYGRVQLSSLEALQVMQRAGVDEAAALVGRGWDVLCLQPVLGPKALPTEPMWSAPCARDDSTQCKQG